MPTIDFADFLTGLLLAIALLGPLAWFLSSRAWWRGESAGRQAADTAIGLLRADVERLGQELSRADTEIDRLRERIEHMHRDGEQLAAERSALRVRVERIEHLESELQSSRREAATLGQRLVDVQARAEEQQRAATGRLRDLEGARERMKAEFQALANDILEDKSRRFAERNHEQLGHLLNPLREQIGDFRKTVSDAYEKESGARIELRSELKQLLDLNKKLSGEANNLTRALTADNRSQGYWGELKLERLLELAGLEKGREYLTQESFRDGDGDLFRPDAVLKLPGGRDIVIDAKVTLTDYQRACASEDGHERERHFGQHVAALRRHIQQLGEKDYSGLEGLDSPDLVFMFVPVEGAFLEALRRDSAIHDDAFRKRIIPVGPSNLLASLRLVAQIWRTEDQNRNARMIADKAGALYDKFVGFVDDMGKLGDALDRAQRMHQSALGKLAQGKGNLVRRAEQLRSLGVSPGKQLPDALLDLSDSSGDDPD